MIHNDLQRTVLSLLSETARPPAEVLRPILEEHRAEPDLHARLVAALLNVEIEEDVARARLGDLLDHHRELEGSVGRRVDLRVAAMDYLVLHPEIIRSPTIIDHSLLELTQRLAAVDELTGLFNRRFLETYLTKELNRAKRYDQFFSVLFLDLDDFKKINDSHGHAVGDRVLAGLGRTVTDMLRQEDFAARYGGEEFTIILPQTSADGAMAFGERLRESVRALDAVPDVQVTISAGVAAYPRHGSSVDELLHNADAALYHAKLSGKDQVVISTADKRASRRLHADLPAVAYAGTAEIGPLRLCDVSEGGYSAVSSDLLKPGQSLRLRVSSAVGDEPREYDVLAHVIWSHRVGANGTYRAGGEWAPTDREAVSRIVQSAAEQGKR